MMNNSLKEFEQALKHHDWYFDYSDDHRVWQRGMHSIDALRAQYAVLVGAGHRAEANELWHKYAPAGHGAPQ